MLQWGWEMIRLHGLQMSASKSLPPKLVTAPKHWFIVSVKSSSGEKFFLKQHREHSPRTELGEVTSSLSLLHKGINRVKKLKSKVWKLKAYLGEGDKDDIAQQIPKISFQSKSRTPDPLHIKLLSLCFHIQSIKWKKKASVHTINLSANCQSQNLLLL